MSRSDSTILKTQKTQIDVTKRLWAITHIYESCDTGIDKIISEDYRKKISTHERVQSSKNKLKQQKHKHST